MDGNLITAAEALTEAVGGRTCTSAWLGYGDVLFLGFGEVTVDGDSPDQRGVPQYEVETNFADWDVESFEPPAADQDERVVHSLVGLPVTGWQLVEGHGFQVEFGGRCRVRVTPMPDADLADNDAWSVSLPGLRHDFSKWCCEARLDALAQLPGSDVARSVQGESG